MPAGTHTAAQGQGSRPPRAERVEGFRTDAAPWPRPPRLASPPRTSRTGSGKDAASSERRSERRGRSGRDEKDLPVDHRPDRRRIHGRRANPAALNNAAALAHAVAVRGSPQTVANLAAQIAKKLDGRSSRFDVQLDPAGLGKVDVRVEIDSAGKMTAALNFDNQQAANELKSRSGELLSARVALVGYVGAGFLFDVGQAGQGASGPGPGRRAGLRRAGFQAALDGSADAPSPCSLLFMPGVRVRRGHPGSHHRHDRHRSPHLYAARGCTCAHPRPRPTTPCPARRADLATNFATFLSAAHHAAEEPGPACRRWIPTSSTQQMGQMTEVEQQLNTNEPAEADPVEQYRRRRRPSWSA